MSVHASPAQGVGANRRFQLATLARARGHVLAVGPLGAGKETVARGLHGLSSRAGRAVVARHASTIGSMGELFGDASSDPPREGIIETADGSTLLLDAVDQLAVELQSALLRVLDHGEVHRVGEARPRRIDARLVCTGTGPPSDALLARLQLRIDVPGLEQRREDVPLLMRALLARAREQVPELRQRFAEETGATLD